MESLEDFYNKVLNLEFLIEYGYYDRNVKSEINSGDIDTQLNEDFTESQFYSVGDNFFPDYFSTKGIAKFLQNKNLIATIDEDYMISYDANNIIGETSNTYTDPIIFTIPKGNDISIRRTYKMPNIYSYVRLAHYIDLNKEYFKELFINNKQSTSKYFNHFQMGNFKTTDKLSTNLLSFGTNVLNLDLSNFYPTLYTHSLAWVDLGKQIAKMNRDGGIGNNLDKLVQAEQFGETHGVPTGNYLTRIIAEYFLCKIDKELEALGFIYTRYVDDIRFSFNEEKTKNDFLSQVHIKSNEYNITLNERKTFVEKYPAKNDLNKSLLFSFFENFKSNDYLKWIDKMYDYINICIDEEAKGNKGSVKILYTGSLFHLKDNSKIDEIFTYKNPSNGYNLFKHFLDISLKDSKLANRFLNFSKKLISSGVSRQSLNQLVNEYFKEHSKEISSKINTCIENKYNQEVYQLLLYYLYFEVYDTIDEDQMINLIGEEDANDEENPGILIKIINISNDDFSIILALTIYLQIIINEFLEVNMVDTYNLYMDKLLNQLNQILSSSYQSYLSESDKTTYPVNKPNTSRMRERFWFLRYHLYYLTNNYTTFKNSINKYFSDNRIPKSRRGTYMNQLNWDYVKTNKKIDKFYSEMLIENIPLFYFDYKNYN